MDWNVIDKCANSDEGIKLEYDMAIATENLSPAHQYVPWIVSNGQHSSSAENAINSNMVKYVCSTYQGS